MLNDYANSVKKRTIIHRQMTFTKINKYGKQQFRFKKDQ